MNGDTIAIIGVVLIMFTSVAMSMLTQWLRRRAVERAKQRWENER